MCGICGELRFDNGAPDLASIKRMTAALARRGPDHEGLMSDGPLAFGHRRLAIIDLSARADQPLVDKDLRLALVFNGTIYNYKELRAELVGMGYAFVSEGDSEVILKAYHAWGEKCVERFFGMFAFAVWDMRFGTLFLARDRFGIKPLYYSLEGVRLRFASSVQSLLASGDIDTRIDRIALHHHLTLHAVVPAPRTLLEGVRKLPPATTLTIGRDGRFSQRCYWSLEATRPQRMLSEDDWITATRYVLGRAIERHRLAADVPVGVLLSGGLDSSLVVAMMAQQGVHNLLTFSIGFEHAPGEPGDEFEYSDLVAKHFGTRHHRYSISNAELLARIPETVRHMSEPMVSQDVAAFDLLGEKVHAGAKVVMSGQGADEVFGGYPWYPRMQAERGAALERFARHYFDRRHDEYLQAVTPAFHVADVTSEAVAAELSKPDADEFLDQVLRFDVTTLIVDDPVKRVDNMMMAWAVEARVPFLDHEVVELAARMPPSLRLKEGGKFPLKAAARGLLPDAVIDRPKVGFPVPALKYVRGPFLDYMRGMLDSKACRERGLFERAYVEKLLAAPEAHTTPLQGAKLWHLALLEAWLQENVDRR